MSYVDERTTVGTLLKANWTATPLYGPNDKFNTPAAASDPASPVGWVAWEIDYQPAEQITFSGTAHVRGSVRIGVWVEAESKDNVVRGWIDTLRSIFQTGDSGGLQFLEPVIGGAEEDGQWYGRLISVPFHRFKEP